MRSLLTIAALILAGCGSLSNRPLREGTVEGVVAEADSRLALVSVLGQPGLRAEVREDGSFTLLNVPSGQNELFVIADGTHAARLSVSVSGARTTSVSIQPEAGAFVQFRVTTPGMQSGERAFLSISGTPYLGLPLEADGERRVGPLPAGCYSAELSGALGSRVNEFCVQAGEEREEGIEIQNDGSANCERTGCALPLHCAAEGACVECTEDAHCGAGGHCLDHRCRAQIPATGCTPCTYSWQCGDDSTCENGLCQRTCSDSGTCDEAGFACNAGLCVPNPAEFTSCSGYRHVGTPCTDDLQCREEGLVNGRCDLGVCTLTCEQDHDCPTGFGCVQRGAEKYCVRP